MDKFGTRITLHLKLYAKNLDLQQALSCLFILSILYAQM